MGSESTLDQLDSWSPTSCQSFKIKIIMGWTGSRVFHLGRATKLPGWLVRGKEPGTRFSSVNCRPVRPFKGLPGYSLPLPKAWRRSWGLVIKLKSLSSDLKKKSVNAVFYREQRIIEIVSTNQERVFLRSL